MLDDLLNGKTWLVYDGTAVIGTITIDPEEPLIADKRTSRSCPKLRSFSISDNA